MWQRAWRLGWLVCAMAALVSTAGAGTEPCGVFVLARGPAGLTLERQEIAPGTVQVLQANAETGIIDVILPPGHGTSGGVTQLDPGGLHVLRCDGTNIRHQVQLPSGRKVDFPARDLADLARDDIRVSVVGGNGSRASFLIAGYRTAEPDSGPIQNLFAGTPLPLGKNDYVITTDTHSSWSSDGTSGEASLQLKRYPFVRAEGPDGKPAWFILDLGGAETLVARSFLPAGTTIEKSNMVEYSSAGRRLLDYAPGGATGKVMGIRGHARLPELRLGGIRFRSADVAVMDTLPNLFDRPVAGILGIDLLSRAERVTLEFPAGAEGAGTLKLGPARASGGSAGPTREVPFSFVNRHMAIGARVNDVPCYFLLDTGSPSTLLDESAATATGVRFALDPDRPVHGLDRGKVESGRGVIDVLRLGGADFDGVECDVAPLETFVSLRQDGQHLGLLGNRFLARFERVEIDFPTRRVRLVGEDRGSTGAEAPAQGRD